MQPLEFPPFAKEKLITWADEIASLCVQLLTEETGDLNEEQKADVETIQNAAQRLKEDVPTLYNWILVGISYTRTHLNCILGYAEILQKELDGRINDMQRETLHRIEVRGNKYAHALNNFLDFARLLYSDFKLFVEHVNLGVLSQNLSELHREVQFEASELQIMGDELRIKQCIQELIHNAQTHAPNSPIELTIAQQADYVVISVTDQGKGIPAAHHADIFKPFWRYPDDSDTFGMGLAVVKGITELHGGRVSVASAVGVGSTFTLYLPHPRMD